MLTITIQVNAPSGQAIGIKEDIAAYDKDMKEVREDIEKIKANYITKEDFFREQAKTDRKLDRIMDILLEMKGDKKGE